MQEAAVEQLEILAHQQELMFGKLEEKVVSEAAVMELDTLEIIELEQHMLHLVPLILVVAVVVEHTQDQMEIRERDLEVLELW